MAVKNVKDLTHDIGKLAIGEMAKKIFPKISSTAGPVAGIVGSFVITFMLDELFGSEEKDDFKEVFDRLDEIETLINNSALETQLVIIGSAIDVHIQKINSEYNYLASEAKLDNEDSLKTVFTRVFKSVYSTAGNTTITQLDQATAVLYDHALGAVTVPKSFLNLQYEKCLADQYSIAKTNFTIKTFSIFCFSYFVKAQLVLRTIVDNHKDPVKKNAAMSLNDKISGYSEDLVLKVNEILKDALEQEVLLQSGKPTLIHSLVHKKVLGRYAFFGPNAYLEGPKESQTYFTMQSVGGAGVIYLKNAYQDLGIDAYYGKSLKVVNSDYSNHPNHLWSFVADKPNNRWFKIVNHSTSQLIVHPPGQDVQLSDHFSGDSDLWELIYSPLGDNTFQIVNKATKSLLGFRNGEVFAFIGERRLQAGVLSTNILPAYVINPCYFMLKYYPEQDVYAIVDTVDKTVLKSDETGFFTKENIDIPASADDLDTKSKWRIESVRAGGDQVQCYLRSVDLKTVFALKTTTIHAEYVEDREIDVFSMVDPSGAAAADAEEIWRFET